MAKRAREIELHCEQLKDTTLKQSEEIAKQASKMKVPKSEKYAQRLIVEGNDALQACYSTIKYIGNNLEKQVRIVKTATRKY